MLSFVLMSSTFNGAFFADNFISFLQKVEAVWVVAVVVLVLEAVNSHYEFFFLTETYLVLSGTNEEKQGICTLQEATGVTT